jgi:hypothetical protein
MPRRTEVPCQLANEERVALCSLRNPADESSGRAGSEQAAHEVPDFIVRHRGKLPEFNSRELVELGSGSARRLPDRHSCGTRENIRDLTTGRDQHGRRIPTVCGLGKREENPDLWIGQVIDIIGEADDRTLAIAARRGNCRLNRWRGDERPAVHGVTAALRPAGLANQTVEFV